MKRFRRRLVGIEEFGRRFVPMCKCIREREEQQQLHNKEHSSVRNVDRLQRKNVLSVNLFVPFHVGPFHMSSLQHEAVASRCDIPSAGQTA